MLRIGIHDGDKITPFGTFKRTFDEIEEDEPDTQADGDIEFHPKGLDYSDIYFRRFGSDRKWIVFARGLYEEKMPSAIKGFHLLELALKEIGDIKV